MICTKIQLIFLETSECDKAKAINFNRKHQTRQEGFAVFWEMEAECLVREGESREITVSCTIRTPNLTPIHCKLLAVLIVWIHTPSIRMMQIMTYDGTRLGGEKEKKKNITGYFLRVSTSLLK